MSILQNIFNGLRLGSTAVQESNGTLNGVAKALDNVQKRKGSSNKLGIYRTSHNLHSYHSNLLRQALRTTKSDSELYCYGDPQRDFMLANFAKMEPILAGAIYSMTVKFSALSWTVIGRKNLASYYANVLDNALSMNSVGWGDFGSSTAHDFCVLDRGTFWHTPRIGSNLTGKLSQLVYMDPLACAMTGNMNKPVYYNSYVTGQSLFLKPGEFAHFASMVSPREEHFGIGFSPTSRAYKSARILYGLADYDWQKLNNLPPEGVASVTGLTKDEFLDSLEIWKSARESNQSLTYPMVLWLLASQPNTAVKVDFTGFSQLPESFNRRDVIDQYVNILALDFGVDAREFWPVSTSSMGTAAESEIQHMKARGKGHAELITIVERYFNSEMPDGVEFGFDTQDVAEDQLAAGIAKGWVDALMPLYNPGGSGTPSSKTPMAPGNTAPEGGASQSNLPQPKGGGSEVEPVITKNQLLRLLIDRRVLPGWLLEDGDDRLVRTDLGIEEKMSWRDGDGDSPVVITYKEGRLRMSRPVPYTMIGNKALNLVPVQRNSEIGRIPYAKPLNVVEREFRGLEDALDKEIQGQPIPEHESLRGPRITKRTVEQELELWRNTPELQAYAPTLDEQDLIDGILGQVK